MTQLYLQGTTIRHYALALSAGVFAAMALNSSPASAACPVAGITNASLTAALQAAVTAGNGGLGFPMWATIVDRDGVVCTVARSAAPGLQWPGSRVISAQKANTANAFSLPSFALSTANLFSATQPGGSLFGLQESNPVDTSVAYKGPSHQYGTPNDPMRGEKIGGVNVFGGGLALYNANGRVIGAVGVSGDTSCADHRIGWRVRDNLNLDNLAGVGGVSGDPLRPDDMIFDITPNPAGGTGISAGGFGHPECLNTDKSDLPAVQ